MFVRSILIPTLLVGAIAAPILFSHNQQSSETSEMISQQPVMGPASFASASPTSAYTTPVYPASQVATNLQSPTANLPSPFQTNPAQRSVPFGLASSQSVAPPSTTPELPASTFGVQTQQFAPASPGSSFQPDLAATQTMVFPGNQFGPNLSAQPLEFMPITDFREIFRFDITPQWITQRWKRVSTKHNQENLHGYRVALVTGVNSWDLHGALTYYFNDRQQVQRLTFRGWTGDATRLLDLLTNQYSLQPQPTHLAGFYLAESWGRSKSALMMKHPDIISQDNPLQRLGIVMEINNPESSVRLSQDFQSLIAGSHPN